MNKDINKKMFIICVVYVLISSCANFTSRLSKQGSLSEQGLVSEQVSDDTIKFSKFTVKIKNKDNSSNWINLGTLVIEKEKDGIATGLNNDDQGGGHTAKFFSLEESEVNNFVKAMTEGGTFKTNLYYGYREQSTEKGIQNKQIITKIEKINGSEYITFSGDRIKDSGDRTTEYVIYAISLEELKKNLK
ncbi:Erp family outer-surface lipoprotein [Borreliella valaisiana]|uniref:Outer surface protein E n=2 Tax=Borreliella valaisiana TaxID=62088 RepID=C0R9A3_BORVA|nr:Erp family outer-surface lipoprotein [Borreliella valaisiana]ACN52937.1 outer surface protein E [Borreliella valaisiana VS116]